MDHVVYTGQQANTKKQSFWEIRKVKTRRLSKEMGTCSGSADAKKMAGVQLEERVLESQVRGGEKKTDFRFCSIIEETLCYV